MQQHWWERFKMRICKYAGHKRKKKKEVWEYYGKYHSVCKRCGCTFTLSEKEVLKLKTTEV